MADKKKVGYSFWGFLGDKKFNDKYEEVSTPDGNAFYSWSIIRELQKRGYSVFGICPDRDLYGYRKMGNSLFESWAKEARCEAYEMSYDCIIDRINPRNLNEEIIMSNFDRIRMSEFEFVLHEWRMEIQGRNDFASISKKDWQPDLLIQKCLIKYCKENRVPLVIFDLDYKLSEEKVEEMKDFVKIIELGDKWSKSKYAGISKKVYIPFDFSYINEFRIRNNCRGKLVYVGNRYERDWCIDKYIPGNMYGCAVYGNWKEGGRDSEERWPSITFGKRLQTSEMNKVYSDHIATVLLAKKEYCKYNFMTARLIESVFYGTVPMFIEEYGEETIDEYAGIYAEFLTVRDKEDVWDTVNVLSMDSKLRRKIIEYLRRHLRMMDCKFFVDDLLSLA